MFPWNSEKPEVSYGRMQITKPSEKTGDNARSELFRKISKNVKKGVANINNSCIIQLLHEYASTATGSYH